MSDSPRFASPRIRWSGLVDAALFAGLAGSWIGLLGRWHWLPDLFSHFRWQAIVVCFVALVWAGWRKRRWVMGAALLTLVLNVGWLAAAGGTGAGAGTKPGFQVRVVAFNVLTSNRNHAGVLDWLQQTDADLIFLMEVDRLWAEALEPLLVTHPHHLIQALDDNFGLALYSRIPFQNASILTPSGLSLPEGPGAEMGMDSVAAHFQTDGREWIFLGTHPVPPMSRLHAAGRDLQLAALAKYIARAGAPVLLAGDLNASPWSQGFRQLTAEVPLRAAPGSWKPTWRAGSPLGIPIDHALASPALAFKSRRIGPDLGSDHRPQVLELGWAE